MLRAFDHICMEKARYKFLIIIIIIDDETLGSFRLEYEYEIEYEYDFSILVCGLQIIKTHTYFNPWLLLSLPKINMKNEGSGKVSGLKFENRTRTQSRTRSPI